MIMNAYMYNIELQCLLVYSNYTVKIKPAEQHCVADEFSEIKGILETWSDKKNIDLILTVDVTPEVTKAIIDREAPHLASRMILGCCEKSKFSVLSRSVCGMCGQSLILNLPSSVKGSTECFDMIASVLPHALDQLKGRTKRVASLHTEIQKN
ncbi:Gephyrin [Araneus ventricosus]|uniref:Gephyrin n=1 Tax=Araneus ventricosus TaxID=182803 RepID=A0A4Y2BA82_ARAVE|nr:Gephyrin [Araneus ventricosus]